MINKLSPSGHLEEFSDPIAEQQTEPILERHQAQNAQGDEPENQHELGTETASSQGYYPGVPGYSQLQPMTQRSQA